MNLTPKQRQNLARLVRAKQQPAKHDPRYANEAEAMHAHLEELRVQIYGPEAVFGDDGRAEVHPYFGGRGGESSDPYFRYWS